jgi:hypothetical protein
MNASITDIVNIKCVSNCSDFQQSDWCKLQAALIEDKFLNNWCFTDGQKPCS